MITNFVCCNGLRDAVSAPAVVPGNILKGIASPVYCPFSLNGVKQRNSDGARHPPTPLKGGPSRCNSGLKFNPSEIA